MNASKTIGRVHHAIKRADPVQKLPYSGVCTRVKITTACGRVVQEKSPASPKLPSQYIMIFRQTQTTR